MYVRIESESIQYEKFGAEAISHISYSISVRKLRYALFNQLQLPVNTQVMEKFNLYVCLFPSIDGKEMKIKFRNIATSIDRTRVLVRSTNLVFRDSAWKKRKMSEWRMKWTKIVVESHSLIIT